MTMMMMNNNDNDDDNSDQSVSFFLHEDKSTYQSSFFVCFFTAQQRDVALHKSRTHSLLRVGGCGRGRPLQTISFSLISPGPGPGLTPWCKPCRLGSRPREGQGQSSTTTISSRPLTLNFLHGLRAARRSSGVVNCLRTFFTCSVERKSTSSGASIQERTCLAPEPVRVTAILALPLS